jgi:hypothetical protein
MKPTMNRYQFSRNLMGIACACLVLAACETNQPGGTNGQPNQTSAGSNKSGGHLIVHRAANLGTGLILSVDGARVAEIRVGDSYDGYLTAGRHIVSAIPAPNEVNQVATSVTLAVENGQTYSFTASRRGDQVILTKDS